MESIEMKQTKYRVEAFIIPVGNQFRDHEEENGPTKTEDRLKDGSEEEEEETDKMFPDNEENRDGTGQDDAPILLESESMQNLRNSLLLHKIIDSGLTGHDKPWKESSHNTFEYPVTKTKRVFGGLKTSQLLDKVSTLVSIDEKAEDTDERVTDFCYHGCKNGCSAVIPSPQEVSEKVFQENWLKKLEMIKEKETALRNKEAILQDRERALFRREREVRILERHFRDRLKQVKQYISQNMISEDLKSPNVQDTKYPENLPPRKIFGDVCTADRAESTPCGQDAAKESTLQEQPKKIANSGTVQNEKSQSEKAVSLKSSSSLSSSSDSNATEERRKKSGSRSSATQKSKKPPKIHYEDLDTTLSADVGDYSFVQTSQKFNPDLYRKPFAFTRSASERRPKSVEKSHGTFESQIRKEDTQYSGIEQERILKKVTENISASQDRNTKYQNYGLIDRNLNGSTQSVDDCKEEKRCSYLNLEITGRLSIPGNRQPVRDRPISWNAEANEWLQKKRQAYSVAAKKRATKDLEDKENLRQEDKTIKQERTQKKTDIKSLIFTIFR